MFSQRDEEKFILEFFKGKTGKFLDIGAYDGKCFSTTHALALLGWSGVCIEPSPSVFPALQTLYKDNSSVNTLEYAITNKNGSIDFYDSGGDMVSSVDKKHIELWEKGSNCKFTKIKVDSLTVTDLFKKIGYNFDFISLDVEGTNLEIVEKFPFDKLKKVKMFCIEFDNKEDIVLQLIKPFGFTLLHKTCENLLLIRN